MQAGLDNMRKGALQTVFGLAVAVIDNDLTKLSRAQVAAIYGWDKDTAPKRDSKNVDEKRLAERAKTQAVMSGKIAESLMYIDPLFIERIAALKNDLTAPAKFAVACDKILSSIKFFDGVDISTQKALIEWFESALPETAKDDENSDKVTHVDDSTEDGSTPSESGTKTSSDAAKTLAAEQIALLMELDPAMQPYFIAADKAASKSQAVAIIAQAYSDKLAELTSELQTLRTIHNAA